MELEQQLEQYLAAVPLKKFQWTEVCFLLPSYSKTYCIFFAVG